MGHNAGYHITTGSKNTILGRYNGNQGGLDIRTSSNYIVLSDGDGNPRGYWDGSAWQGFGGGPMTKISTTTVTSAVSSVGITLPTSGYTHLRLQFSNVKNATDTVAAQIRLSADGGSNFKSLYYVIKVLILVLLINKGSGTTLTISETVLSNSANTQLFGFIDIHIPTERSTVIQFNVG